MQKTPQKPVNKLFSLSRRAVLSLLVLVLLTASASTIIVRAATCSSKADCSNQINNLQNQNSAAQGQLGNLVAQAGSYQAAISALQSQIDSLSNAISANQAKQVDLQSQIVAKQAELDHQRQVLASDVKAMYVDDQMSTIEMLATSKNLSDYVDKEEYRQTVQNKIRDTMAQIADLQKQLQSEKTEVDNLLTTEKTQQGQLASQRAQQAQLLAYNSSQQAAYNATIAANRKSIGSLQARLSALNTTAGSRVLVSGTCGGGYPAKASGPRGSWGCNYPQDNTIDNWQMLNRECVSYTAWMAYKTYGISTSGWGSAYKWINAAAAHGYRVDQTPAPGTVAIRDVNWSEPGDVGHAMWVDSVQSSHDITVWEYNRHYDGTFDERRFDPYGYSAPVYYIHFR
jgi:surface antigen/peptidoglycan hydrolase CwlO-like protein